MTPEAAIAALNRQLRPHGQTVRIRRGPKGSTTVTGPIKGFVRGFSDDEIAAGSGISQQDDRVILSPTDFADWVLPMPGEGDWCEIDGQFRSVIKGRVRKINDTVVRIELQVKG